jgi:DNA-binding MarR family transcriptional regulator
MKLLTPREVRLWNAWELFTEAVSSRISHEVAQATGLSGADYRVLSCLVDRGHGQLRQRELATALDWDKSRISHQLTRMQERNLLKRTKTAERGSNVAITTAGRTALETARPVHAHSVRRYLIERLTPAQVTAILAIGGDANGIKSTATDG